MNIKHSYKYSEHFYQFYHFRKTLLFDKHVMIKPESMTRKLGFFAHEATLHEKSGELSSFLFL